MIRRWISRGRSAAAEGGWRASPDIEVVIQEGRAVLLDLRTERYFGLDEVGTRMWSLAASGLRPREIAAELASEYDAPAERLEADAAAFTARLSDAGLLVCR